MCCICYESCVRYFSCFFVTKTSPKMCSRERPNVLITGTPATGKTSICERIRRQLPDYEVMDVSHFCRNNGCIESHDNHLDTDIIDEDMLDEKLSPAIASGGYLVDHHSPSLIAKELIDVVFIMRCNNTLLYDRLKERSYSEVKITANIECEIFETIVEEAVEWFGSDVCHQLTNETEEELDTNCQKICDWIQKYKPK
ncbi:unnamed protein product [Medioppia subpectinata]|uniref:Adenylate kinase isoenzyme 6 homolog n=1 Tax=Medioppia subpectinata TaxID=1979941 RepID=A0A7R9PWV7_9ACAR|nr:unnamed protein product [Medioppia subpectinata]CAG2103709.1 unnamed protein product [Medioppia subpectinata]